MRSWPCGPTAVAPVPKVLGQWHIPQLTDSGNHDHGALVDLLARDRALVATQDTVFYVLRLEVRTGGRRWLTGKNCTPESCGRGLMISMGVQLKGRRKGCRIVVRCRR